MDLVDIIGFGIKFSKPLHSNSLHRDDSKVNFFGRFLSVVDGA